MEQEKKISTQHTESETTESAVENQETTAVAAASQQDVAAGQEEVVDSGKNQSHKHDKKHRQGKSKKSKDSNQLPFYKRPGFRYSTLSTVLVVIFIVCVAGVNVLASFVSERFNLDLDLTASGDYTLTEENVEYVRNLNKPVVITVSTTEDAYTEGTYLDLVQSTYYCQDPTGGRYFKQAIELLKNYAKVNSNITVQFVDSTSPAFYEYQDRFNNSVVYGDIIVECTENEKYKILGLEDLYEIQSSSSSYMDMYYGGSYYISGSMVETAVTSALSYVNSDETDVMTIIEGYNTNEQVVSVFQQYYQSQNYLCQTIQNLTASNIPEDTDILVMLAPTTDLTDDEIKKIDEFLVNDGAYGKHLLYFASPDQRNTPNLDALLREWGIECGSGTVYETDTDNYLAMYGATSQKLEVAVEDGAYTDNLSDRDVYGLLQRPVTALFQEMGKYTVTELLKTSETSTIMPIDADINTWQPADDAVYEYYDAMVLSTYSTGDHTGEQEQLQSSVCVVAGVYDLEFINMESYGNGQMLMNVTNNMVRRDADATFSVENKALTVNTVSLTESQSNVILLVSVVGVTAVVLATGIVIYVRRKRR